MSDSRYPTGAPLDRIRALLTLRVEGASLRQVARDVGMSPSGLQKLLDGSEPYTPTRRKLERWYVRESGRAYGVLDTETAAAAIELLLQDLPLHARPTAADRVRALLDELYSAIGKRPRWLDHLLENGR